MNGFKLIHKETGTEITTENVREFLYPVDNWFGREVKGWKLTYPEPNEERWLITGSAIIEDIILYQDGTPALVCRYDEYQEIVPLKKEDYEIVWMD